MLGLVNEIVTQGYAYVWQWCAIQCDAANLCCFGIVFYRVHASTDRKGERTRKGWAPAAAALSKNNAFAAKQCSKEDHRLEPWLLYRRPTVAHGMGGMRGRGERWVGMSTYVRVCVCTDMCVCTYVCPTSRGDEVRGTMPKATAQSGCMRPKANAQSWQLWGKPS